MSRFFHARSTSEIEVTWERSCDTFFFLGGGGGGGLGDDQCFHTMKLKSLKGSMVVSIRCAQNIREVCVCVCVCGGGGGGGGGGEGGEGGRGEGRVSGIPCLEYQNLPFSSLQGLDTIKLPSENHNFFQRTFLA